MRNFFGFIVLLTHLFSCNKTITTDLLQAIESEETDRFPIEILNDTLINLTDLKRGDLLVKPNHNWFPGSMWVKGGISFGHIAIVVEGATGDSAEKVMQKAVILESQARDVSEEFQLRKVNAYRPGFDYRYDNFSFDPSKAPYRYRLRSDLTSTQIDAIIVFMETYEQGISCWRALKKYTADFSSVVDNHNSYWYCSHYIWQAFYTVLGIDIDNNNGVIVYPNDIIWCSIFDNDSINKTKRVRF